MAIYGCGVIPALAALTCIQSISGTSVDRQRFDFAEVASQAGVHFVLANNPTAEKRMIETMPGGIAAFDFDGDGRPDIFFTNGAEVPSLTKTSRAFWNRLYRNDGDFHFTDVTEQAGVQGVGYAMGAAAADYDNDGYPDLFVAGVNHNQLLHNRGDGTFEDVTVKAGISSGEWAVAAGWFDYDNDGLLDLLVVHYSITPLQDRYCGNRDKDIRIYCHPKYFAPLASTLYHNLGHGHFEDVSKVSGIAKYPGRGMSVAFADYDKDGYMDIFVTNDNMPNYLFHNLRNGTFEEVGLTAGVALPDRGQPVSSMGTDFRDFDNDGRPDIVFSALVGETFPLFRGIDNQTFSDVSYSTRLGPLSTIHSGWGIGLADFDNDGWKDLFSANSHVNDRIEEFESHKYKEPNSVFANDNGRFMDSTPISLKNSIKAHRGCAFADFDGDGRMDVVVSALGEQAELWRNTTTGAQNWISFRLQGSRGNRDGIGVRIRVGNQWNEMTSAVSYASSSLIPVPFGVGKAARVEDVEIHWSNGEVQHLGRVAVNHIVNIKEP